MNDAELRKLALAATEGEWMHYDDFGIWSIKSTNSPFVYAVGTDFNKQDAAYIAAANPQAMIEILDRLEGIESKILAEYNYWKESDGEASIPAMGALSNVLAAIHGHTPTHHKREQ